jgi:gas vesicle protein
MEGMCASMRKTIRSFMIGGLMGIAAGMILMPQLEPETRKKILDRGKDMVEDAAQILPGMNKG